MGGNGVMATQDQILQAIEESNQINQSPSFNFSNLFGGNNQAQDINYPNQLQNESFSDLSYQDMGGVHPPRSHSGLQSIMPHDVGNWRQNNAINYGSTYPQAPFQPNMMDVGGTGQLPTGGITQANAAQGKGNFLTNLLDNTFLGKMAAMRNPLNERSGNYNPALQGQIDYLQSVGGLGPTSEGYKIRGGPLEGKNLVSGFGTNDYDQMLADKQAWFEKRMADEKGYSEGNYQKLLNEIKRRNELETAATAQGAAQSGGWSAADVASSSKAFDHMGGGGPQGSGGWSPAAGQMASGMGGGSQQAKSGSQKAGGSGRTDKGWGWAQGGRVGYKTGGRVGILSVF